MMNYKKAVRIAKDDGKVGIACLQRHLSISYEEAKRIIVQMKADGYISDKHKEGIYYQVKEK